MCPHRFRDQQVVDPPPHVAFACSIHWAPPSVVPPLLVELPERINEARIEDGLEPFAFLAREAVIPCISLRMGQIQFCMCDIEVAAHNHRLSGLNGAEEAEEIAVPRLAIGKSCQLPLRVRDVDVHQLKAWKLGDNQPSFSVVLDQTDPGRYTEWWLF